MPRVKRGVTARARHKKVLKQTKGQIGSRHLLYRRAHEALTHSLFYHDRDRHDRKGDSAGFGSRALTRPAREEGTTYNQLMHGLKLAGIEVDRKILADLAVRDEGAFRTLVEVANQAHREHPRGVITSASNEKIKYARSLTRKKERAAANQFLVEGTRLMEEAMRAGIDPALVFYERSSFDTDPRLRQLVVALKRSSPEVYQVNAGVMRALTDTETPQGIAAVVPIPQFESSPIVKLALILDRVRDPGNLGAILRTAWAAGVEKVLIAPESADLFNSKVVRAGMGAHFFLPVVSLGWEEIASQLQSVPRIYLAEARGSNRYTKVDWAPPVGLIIGGEVEGPSDQARRLATASVSIPMPGSAESLNAGVAAGIILFEAIRTAPD